MKLTEHEMLVTVAAMALSMDDLTGHDIIESLRELGYQHVVSEARKTTKRRTKLRNGVSDNSSIPVKSGGTIELYVRRDGTIDLYAGQRLGPPIHDEVVQPTRAELSALRDAIDEIIEKSR